LSYATRRRAAIAHTRLTTCDCEVWGGITRMKGPTRRRRGTPVIQGAGTRPDTRVTDNRIAATRVT